MTESKKCTKCGADKELAMFFNHPKGRNGKTAQCKDCVRKKNMAYFKTDKGKEVQKAAAAKQRRLSPLKKKARQAVNNAITAGKIDKPALCSDCGVGDCRIEGHHDDYSSPLSVRWLCRGCHETVHRLLKGET